MHTNPLNIAEGFTEIRKRHAEELHAFLVKVETQSAQTLRHLTSANAVFEELRKMLFTVFRDLKPSDPVAEEWHRNARK